MDHFSRGKMDHFSQAGCQLGRGVDRSTLWAGRGIVLNEYWNEEWLGNVVGTVGDAYLGRDKLLSVLCGMRAHARTDFSFTGIFIGSTAIRSAARDRNTLRRMHVEVREEFIRQPFILCAFQHLVAFHDHAVRVASIRLME